MPSSFSRLYPTLLNEPQRPKEWLLTAIRLHPSKEEIQDNLLVRYPRFRIAVDIRIRRERNRYFSNLVLRSNGIHFYLVYTANFAALVWFRPSFPSFSPVFTAWHAFCFVYDSDERYTEAVSLRIMMKNMMRLAAAAFALAAGAQAQESYSFNGA